MKFVFCLLSLLLAFGAASGSVFAQATEDIEGGKDHALLSRMPDYVIAEYDEKEFDSYEFPVGEAKTKTVEGRKTAIGYVPKEGAQAASAVQVRRNYQNAVTKLGGQKVFEDSENVVLTAKTKSGATIWVHVYNNGDNYNLTVVEVEAMKQDVVAADMLSALNNEGRIALYINFDTGKAAVKPESQAIVSQIVALLKENPALKIAVEGHTDNVGDIKSNQVLSEQRAKAVVNAIVAQGVDAKRLTAAGFGQTKPLADNSTEDGRAKNRRVELVKE